MNSRERFRRLLDGMEERLRDCIRRVDSLAKRHEQEMKADLGIQNLAMIRSSKESAIEMLSHSSPKFRKAAMDVLLSDWRLDANDASVPRIEEMALSDKDVQVRAHALSSLGQCFRGTDDSRVGKILAAVVVDESNKEPLRQWAYFGLLQLQYRSPVTMARFPEHVDYNYVNDFLRDGRTASPVANSEQGYLKELDERAARGNKGQ